MIDRTRECSLAKVASMAGSFSLVESCLLGGGKKAWYNASSSCSENIWSRVKVDLQSNFLLQNLDRLCENWSELHLSVL